MPPAHESGSFTPLLQVEQGETYTVVNDHLGMPKELLDGRGRVAWAAAHSAWGRVLEVARDDGVAAVSVSSPFRLLGQYSDDETGLCYTRFRYFDAEAGRWCSPDPLGIFGGENVAAFGGSPTASHDPFGLACARNNTTFPETAARFSEQLGVSPARVGTTSDGTARTVWEPNRNTRIRHESHPHGLRPGDAGYNPRHHGEHYHVETKPSELSWNQAMKQGQINKLKPPGYTPGSGTGFVPGEEFP